MVPKSMSRVTSPNSQLGVSNRISNLTSIPTTEAASISNSVDMNFIDVSALNVVGPKVTRAAPVSNPTSARYGDATVPCGDPVGEDGVGVGVEGGGLGVGVEDGGGGLGVGVDDGGGGLVVGVCDEVEEENVTVTALNTQSSPRYCHSSHLM